MVDAFESYISTLKPAIARLTRAEHRIELVNGSVIELWSSQDVSAGRGRRYHIWVSDESQRQKGLSAFIRGSVRPTLADFKGELYVLGTANGQGTELHGFYEDCLRDPNWFVGEGKLEDNPYIDPEEIQSLREALGPEMAAQELDSQWIRISGKTPFIREVMWNELVGELPSRQLLPSVTLAVDASISGDKTAVLGVCDENDIFYIPSGEIQLFEPTLDGETDFASLENYLLDRWRTGQVSRVIYDPYQLVSVAQSLKSKGVRMVECTQNSERIKADTFLKQLCTEKRLRHPDDPRLNEHALNAVLRFSTGMGNEFRIVKHSPDQKIDLLVCASMAAWFHKKLGGSGQIYQPVTDNKEANKLIQKLLSEPVAGSPFIGNKSYSPWD